MSRRPKIRRAKHAGSWYDSDGACLDRELSHWLAKAGKPEFGPAKAIIAPHAGYLYSAECAAFAYKELSPEISRIFILGPSHHLRLGRSVLSPATVYETPMGNLEIDLDTYSELHATGMFEEMDILSDEKEHSLELHLPYIVKSLGTRVKIVPMLIGPFDHEKYGQILAKYLAAPENAFIISSDFCHWGKRFDYQFYHKSWGDIYQSIERLDKLGMKAIKDLKLDSFTSYLNEYNNTICGRHPIAVLLAAIQYLNRQPSTSKYNIKFLKYAQSSKCRETTDSSVSYVAASVKEFPNDHALEVLDDIADV